MMIFTKCAVSAAVIKRNSSLGCQVPINICAVHRIEFSVHTYDLSAMLAMLDLSAMFATLDMSAIECTHTK